MFCKKMLLMKHFWTPEAGVEKTQERAGSNNALNIRTLYIIWQLFLHCK
jgi:hypothetical protein